MMRYGFWTNDIPEAHKAISWTAVDPIADEGTEEPQDGVPDGDDIPDEPQDANPLANQSVDLDDSEV